MSFSKDQVYCVLDYETYSEAPLKKTGAFEYAAHPSTEILCVAWRIGTRETLPSAQTKTWAPRLADPNGNFGEFLRALRDPKVILVAHNAMFEQVVTRNTFATKYMRSLKDELQSIGPERWLCTASLAAALALPRSLEKAAQVLKLPVQKDMAGSRLIMKWCKPKKPSKKDPGTRHSDPEEFNRLVAYCATDVDTEVELFLICPPLNPTERKVWELDQKINLRGFEVDRPRVKNVLGMIERVTKEATREAQLLSYGFLQSPKQRDAILSFLEAEGVYLPNLQKGTVEAALNEGLVQGNAKRMLELRQAVSKTSTAKYEAMELRSRYDGRVRDNLMYWGASTGRWSGLGLQIQNFPKGALEDPIGATLAIEENDPELLEMLYGDLMVTLSACLRSMITASAGKVLNAADYNAIEARVLFWVANHTDGIQAFAEGRDLYKEMAAFVLNKPISEITSKERFLGKSIILGCGYSMGGETFYKTSLKQGADISKELAIKGVRAYREKHQPVVRLWNNVNRASILAVQNPGKRYTVNRTTWFVRGRFLWCELPSGRRLAYFGPTILYEPTPWGERRAVLYHWSVHPITKKWVNGKTYGGRLVENIVQAISRDFMAHAMLKIEAAGPWEILFSVHDELVAARDPKEGGSIEEYEKLMTELPEWGAGCPLKVEGWEGERYRK